MAGGGRSLQTVTPRRLNGHPLQWHWCRDVCGARLLKDAHVTELPLLPKNGALGVCGRGLEGDFSVV